MDPIEDPADAKVQLLNALRVLALTAAEQIALFEPHCVACGVRETFSSWEDEFDDSPYAKGMSKRRKMAVGFVRMACEAILADPEFECHENSYVCESPRMEAVREAATKALATFGWSMGAIDHKYVPGTPACVERRRTLYYRRKQENLALRRMEPSAPRFHAATFKMHGHPLARNRARMAEVDRWEAKHGIKLPAAVREWYEFEGNDLWERIRPRDGVIRLAELEPVRLARVREWRNSENTFICLYCDSDGDFEFVEPVDAFQYLTVCCESDLGIPSLVRLDSSDDPPVYIRPECGDELAFVSPRYSAFQFDQLADERFSRYEDTIIFEVEDRLPNESEVARLRASLSSGPVSQGGWPGWHYRFFTENAFVGSGHTYGEVVELPFWEFRATSNDALVEVLRVVWPIANLATKLERKVMSLGIPIDSLM